MSTKVIVVCGPNLANVARPLKKNLLVLANGTGNSIHKFESVPLFSFSLLGMSC